MKINILLLCALFIPIILISCNVWNTYNEGTTTGTSNDIVDKTEMEIPEKAVKAYVGFDSLKSRDYDLINCAEAHYKSDRASKDYCDLYQFADDISILPAYGTYLEDVGMVVVLFYKEDFFIGTVTLKFEINEEDIITEEYDTFNYTTIPDALSDLACYYEILSCIKYHPNFQITGIVYNSLGDSIIVIGKNEGENYIKYVLVDPEFFNLVDPFSTIEEGRQAFAEYLAHREEIDSSLHIYPWKTINLDRRGYMDKYERNDMYISGDPAIESDVLSVYDSINVLPLLDSNYQENVYVLHLLYYRNRLIAEFVIENTTDANGSHLYSCVWKNISEKNDDGTYSDLNESKYEQIIALAQSFIYSTKEQDNEEIIGVTYFSGDFYPIIKNNKGQSFYNWKSNEKGSFEDIITK